MKFLRILPEMCASTLCLFSSCTRNIAFGKGSMTVAITSMASSFGLPASAFSLSGGRCFLIKSCSFSPRWSSRFARSRQNPRPTCGDGEDVLEVRRIAAVGRNRRPAIFENTHVRFAHVDHRLDRENHAFLQLRPLARIAVVRHVGLFMHSRSDSVAYEFAHD